MLIKIFDIQFRVKLVILLSCRANRVIHGEIVISKLVNWEKRDNEMKQTLQGAFRLFS